ncbi:hypothetical protein OG871_38080 [Kitasatospora sp. NBC_00374]|uniref:hypothetical protein n=1 Tax=Kitasatospora sp. NBC_00374 TaxID=2975964 RepID=UPI0032483FC4
MNSRSEQPIVTPTPQARRISRSSRAGLMAACGALAFLGSIAAATAHEAGKGADDRNTGGVSTLAQGWKGRY